MRCFRKEGRSRRWKTLKANTRGVLRESKTFHLDGIESKSKNGADFFRAVARLKHREAPKAWSVMELFPGKTEEFAASAISQFFNKISQEYAPVAAPDPAITAGFRRIEPYQISGRLGSMRKPKSKIRGDIDPRLNNTYRDLLALPLAYIFDLVRTTGEWPALWNLEHVVVIPKSSCPSSLGEVRNLSCTPLYSKLLESFLLEDLKKTVKLSDSQYGGLKGCGVDHFLVETWQQILSQLDDNRAGTNILSIDFEKAFNRMDHGHCLRDLAKKGAPPPLVAMINAFLFNRRMTVRVGDALSPPLSVPGGSPQGSLLGNYLFCTTIDSMATVDPQPRSPQQQSAGRRPIGAEARGQTPVRMPPPASASTPARAEPDLDQASDDDDHDESFHFFRLRRPHELDSSAEQSFLMPQDEINDELGPLPRWVDEKSETRCYIDDFNNVEKVQVQGSITHISQNRRKCLVHAPQSERVFLGVNEEAQRKNMVVNAKKTQMLCVSTSQDDVKSYINVDGKRILSSDTLKIVGFTFGSRPTVHSHVNAMLGKLRRRLWMLTHLRQSGMSKPSLVSIYKSMIRSIQDFAAPAYHSLLNGVQANEIERIQRRALKDIFGYQFSYRTILEHQNIESLHNRREKLVKNFAIKAAANGRFSPRWFPPAEEHGYPTRGRVKYKVFASKTERLKNSPLYFMRRILNDN